MLFICLLLIISTESATRKEIKAVAKLTEQLFKGVTPTVCVPTNDPDIKIWNQPKDPTEYMILELNHNSEKDTNMALKTAGYYKDKLVASMDLCQRSSICANKTVDYSLVINI